MNKAKKAAKSRGGYALIEIILAIGVLAIVSMVVLQMFALASDVQKRATDTDQASLLAQSTVERYRLHGDVAGQSFYDDQWAPVADGDRAAYVMTFQTQDAGTVTEITVSIRRYGKNVSSALSISGTQPDPLLFELKAALAGEGAGA